MRQAKLEDLSRVHDVLGVERFFDGSHDAQSFAVLFFQEAALSETDPMLTFAGSIHGEGPPDETVVEAV